MIMRTYTQQDKSVVFRAKTCIRIRVAQTKLTASVKTFKTDKVQSQAPLNFFYFERCNYLDSSKKLIFAF